MHATSPAQAGRVRRAALAARLDGKPALIAAGRPRPRNYPANGYPFRASSHFLYFVGLNLPEAALWLDGDDQRLLLPRVDPLDVLWHGAGESAEQLGATSGLCVGSVDELAELARGRLVSSPPLLATEDRALFGGLTCAASASRTTCWSPRTLLGS